MQRSSKILSNKDEIQTSVVPHLDLRSADHSRSIIKRVESSSQELVKGRAPGQNAYTFSEMVTNRSGKLPFDRALKWRHCSAPYRFTLVPC